MKTKIKLITLIIVIIAMMFILTGCTDSYGEIKGTITNKEYKESYHYTTFIKSGKVLVPISHTRPENYRIEIIKEENEETKTKWINVSKEKYEEVQIGDWYEGE